MSERDEFEAWRENCGYNTESFKGVLWLCWKAARATQAVPALTYADGIEAAARWVDKRREDFDAEFGAMDPDTGAFEFRSVTQEEYSWELVEVADGIRELLAAAPQPSPEPENCGRCHTCAPITMENMRMILCPKCGNKRCPHANDHRHACTGSNESGQPGSAY